MPMIASPGNYPRPVRLSSPKNLQRLPGTADAVMFGATPTNKKTEAKDRSLLKWALITLSGGALAGWISGITPLNSVIDNLLPKDSTPKEREVPVPLRHAGTCCEFPTVYAKNEAFVEKLGKAVAIDGLLGFEGVKAVVQAHNANHPEQQLPADDVSVSKLLRYIGTRTDQGFAAALRAPFSESLLVTDEDFEHWRKEIPQKIKS